MSPVLAYSVPDDTIVYVTPSGTKYHREDCTYTTSTSSLTIQEAEARGYDPCSRCSPDVFQGEYIHPDTSHSSSVSSSNNSDPSGIVKNPVGSDQFGSTSPTSSSVSLDVSSEPTSSDELPVLSGLFIYLVFFLFLLLLSVAILLLLVYSFQWLRHRKFKSRLEQSHLPTNCLTVYYTRYGKFFHISDCPRIKGNSKVYPIPIVYVNRLKLSPCPFCNPTTRNISLASPFTRPSSSPPAPFPPSQSHFPVHPPQPPDDPVYFARSGSFYHEKTCPTLNDQENIVKADFKTAFLQLKRPCPVCKPVRRMPPDLRIYISEN